MRVLMLLPLILSSWSVKSNIEALEILPKFNAYDPETGQEPYDRMLAEKLEDRADLSSLLPLPKDDFNATIYLAYNTAVLKKHGQNVECFVKSIFNYLKEWFQNETLGTKVYLTLGGHGHWPISSMMLTNKMALLRKVDSVINNGTIDKNMDHYALLDGDLNGHGFSWMNSVCKQSGERVSVNPLSMDGEEDTARYVANGIGHTLGMCHNFGHQRTSEKVMSYSFQDLPEKLSNCSRRDMRLLYHSQLRNEGRFCLRPNACGCFAKGSICSECSLDYCASRCKPGFHGPFCKKCWPRVQNKGTEGKPDCRGLMLNTNLPGGNIEETTENSIIDCQQTCIKNLECDYFSYEKSNNLCWSKGINMFRQSNDMGLISGLRYCDGSTTNYCFMNGAKYGGLKTVKNGGDNQKATAMLCQISCRQDLKCEAWEWDLISKGCRLLSFLDMAQETDGFITGFRNTQLQNPQVCGCNMEGSVIGACDNFGDCYCKKGYEGSKCQALYGGNSD